MPHPSNETLSAVVAVLRKVTTAPFGSVRIDPAVAMSLLQRAARQDETVLINYVDAAGVATQRVVSPITVAGGQLVAFDSASSRAREFAIHRITSVRAGRRRGPTLAVGGLRIMEICRRRRCRTKR